jgi:hypothetical protein
MGNTMIEPLPEEVRKALNKAKYGWSKWGGPNQGLVQKNLTPEWFCQACQDKQPDELTPYMFEFVEREYIRICSKCHHIRIQYEIQPLQFNVLIEIVRKH